MIDAVFILAGGSGTRLWPASTKQSPKQFMKLKENKSLLQLTIERALAIETAKKVVIITLRDQLDAIKKDCSELSSGKERIVVLPEPAARNTAPAIALAAAYLEQEGEGHATALVLPADHLITPTESFVSDAARAGELAEQGYLVTFGIPPAHPETGYGYIEAGREQPPGYLVTSFKEKPDHKTARKFVDAGNFYWNSGMFCFSAENYLQALSEHRGDITEVFDQISGEVPSRSEGGITIAMDSDEITRLYREAPAESIDYAVMERSRKTAMVKATFSWTDVGSWDEVARRELTPEADILCEDAEGNFVHSDLPVALCGVEDLIVVVKNGAVLVCKKGQSQKVKQIVGQAKEENRTDLL
jgi:mannose-1-phosphate guanylyltransferase/mannose-6-phosphate isomerase